MGPPLEKGVRIVSESRGSFSGARLTGNDRPGTLPFRWGLSRLVGSQRGRSILEVEVAIAIVGLAAVAGLTALVSW